jgi:hypothetical protein
MAGPKILIGFISFPPLPDGIPAYSITAAPAG